MSGLKFAPEGFVSRAPTMSGYFCGGFAVSIVDICDDFKNQGQRAKKVMLISCATRRSGRLARDRDRVERREGEE
jgi:hypothetical protein